MKPLVMNEKIQLELTEHHVREFFTGHEVTLHHWTLGPLPKIMPDFRVLCVSPGPRSNFWTYLSLGASSIRHDESDATEFFVMSPSEENRNIELITMITWYHKEARLGLGHTLPIGEPWLEGSRCNHFLISTPYPFGPDFEHFHRPNLSVRFLWLLPITQSEREFKKTHGLEALEIEFEAHEMAFWNPLRDPVV